MMVNGDNIRFNYEFKPVIFSSGGYRQFITLTCNITAFGQQQRIPSDLEESTVHAGVASSHLVISEAATSTDVRIFDLGFVLSSSDEETKFNSTADMFM